MRIFIVVIFFIAVSGVVFAQSENKKNVAKESQQIKSVEKKMKKNVDHNQQHQKARERKAIHDDDQKRKKTPEDFDTF